MRGKAADMVGAIRGPRGSSEWVKGWVLSKTAKESAMLKGVRMVGQRNGEES